MLVLMVFEILDFAFVFFGCFQGVESTQILPFIRFRVFFPGIDAVLTGLQFTYHN